eukprot:754694-Pleurochrysis_carterae.AAC.1
MQERKLREGSMRRRGAKEPGAHWPSAAGADPAASSGVPSETTLDCKPLPPSAFAGRLSPEASATRAQKHRAEEAVRSHKQRKGVCSTCAETKGGEGAHLC